MEQNSLSYQVTMPEYPDVSYQTWAQKFGAGEGSHRLGNSVYAWFEGNPSYSQWRTNELDAYNAKMSAYNTWLSTGEGLRASAESGSYNPNYFGGSPAQASPLSYSDLNDANGLSDMAQGISGIYNFATALQNLALGSEKVKSARLNNQYLDEFLRSRNDLQEKRSLFTGYSADSRLFENEASLFRRFGNDPSVAVGDILHYGSGDYYLHNAGNSFEYQRNASDIDFVRAGIALREAQENMIGWSAKEKKFYVENIQDLERQLLEGDVDYQKYEKDTRLAAQKAGIATNIVNTLLGVASLILRIPLPSLETTETETFGPKGSSRSTTTRYRR